MKQHNDTFEIVETLGVGGMATVYLARRSDGELVAVKQPHPFLADDPEAIATLEHEALLGARVRHPNVVRVHGIENGALVMELVEGVDLAKLVRTGKRLPLDVVAAIARDMLAGLHAAHESVREDGVRLDVVHRDVSPQNVLIGFDGSARITDFGVARDTARVTRTEEGSIKGKLGYLAPEQLQGACDRRADVFSVGVVIWELLTGRRLRAADGVAVLVEILCASIAAPSVTAPEAAGFDALILRALERSADDRFETAADMMGSLEASGVAIASPERVAAVVRETMGVPAPSPTPRRAKRESRRRIPIAHSSVSRISRKSERIFAGNFTS